VVLTTLVFLALGFSWLFREPRRTPRELFEASLKHLDARRLPKVLSTAEQLEQTADGADPAAVLKALVELKLDRPAMALKALLPADQNGPWRAEILLAAGEALYRTGQFRQADIALSQVIASDPDNLPALRWLSAALYDLGANDRAISVLREIARLDPADYRPHHLLARIHFDFEQFSLCLTDCDAALARPLPAESRDQIALLKVRALVEQREYETVLGEVVNLPPSPESRTAAIRASWSLGRTSDLQHWLDAAHAAGDRVPEQSLCRAEVLEGDGHASEAVDILAEAVARFPNHPQLRLAFSQLLRKTGRATEADEQLEEWKTLQSLRDRLTELNLQAVQDAADPAVRFELAEVCRQLSLLELAQAWQAAAESCAAALNNDAGQP
jgi:tetratricopeptide (TPR) repeat protein